MPFIDRRIMGSFTYMIAKYGDDVIYNFLAVRYDRLRRRFPKGVQIYCPVQREASRIYRKR